jgi:hypothetical protein
MKEELIIELTPYLIAITTAAVGLFSTGAIYLFHRGAAYFKQKTSIMKDDTARLMIRDTITRVDEVTEKVVQKIEQTTAGKLREAVKDGKVNRQELLKLSDQAYREVVSMIGPEAARIIEESFGDFSNYIISTIEAKVLALKNSRGEKWLEGDVVQRNG